MTWKTHRDASHQATARTDLFISSRNGIKEAKRATEEGFFGVEAVLEETDRFSDSESESNASYDSVREAAFIEGEDPDLDK